MIFQRQLITLTLFLCSIFIFSCAQRQAIPSPPTLAPPGEKLFQRAEMKFQSKEYRAAIQLYQDYIRIFPESPLVPSIYMKIGTIYLVQNQYAEARKNYHKMIEAVPETQFITDAMLGILTTYYHEGDYKEVLSQAENLNDQSIPRAIYLRKYALLGDSYYATGRSFKSVESYIKVYMATENEEGKKEILAKLEESASNLTAEEIQNLSPLTEDLYLKGYIEYLLGVKYAQNNQYEDAVRQLTHFMSTYPEHKYVEDANRLMGTLSQKPDEHEQPAVGCLLPLSGRYETFGAKALKGIELALMQYSSVNPEVDIRLIIRDTEGSPDTTEAIVNELADRNVTALIGPIINATEAAKQAQSLQIPIITMTQKEGVADIGDYVFRNFLTPEMQMKTMATYAIEHLGLKKFAILYPNEKYGTTFMNLFWDHVIAHGGEISGVEPYAPDQTDFALPIKKLTGRYHNASDEKTNKPVVDFDAIFIPDGPEKSGLILPQLAYYDVTNVYLLGTNLWHSDKLIQMAQQHAKGAIMPEIFFAESTNETVVQFVHNFTETYGEQPGFIEAIAYDTALMVFQTLGSQNLQSRDSIKDKLLNMTDFQGVTGKTSFNPNGEANKELFILQINGDKFSELEHE